MRKTIKQQKILVSLEGRNALVREFGISKTAVYAALKYSTNSETAKAVRKAAVEKYGGADVDIPMLVE